jgi:hypothetical protein
MHDIGDIQLAIATFLMGGFFFCCVWVDDNADPVRVKAK